MSAVCSYNLSTVEDVFSKGKYMQSATVEQAHTKWVQFNGEIPRPRPGAVSCCLAKKALVWESGDDFSPMINYKWFFPYLSHWVIQLLNTVANSIFMLSCYQIA